MRKVRCPRCGDLDKIRIHRVWWMRLIPMSKRYECHTCGHQFLSIRSIFNTELRKTLK